MSKDKKKTTLFDKMKSKDGQNEKFFDNFGDSPKKMDWTKLTGQIMNPQSNQNANFVDKSLRLNPLAMKIKLALQKQIVEKQDHEKRLQKLTNDNKARQAAISKEVASTSQNWVAPKKIVEMKEGIQTLLKD